MKKVILAFSFIAISLFATAQKPNLTGHWVLTGLAQYSSSTPKGGGPTATSLAVLPVFGPFVAPLTLVGLGIGDVYTKNVGDNYKTNTFVIEPLIRQFWATGGGKFFIYGQLDVPIMPGSTTLAEGESSVSGTQWGIELRPGFAYVVSNHWLLESSLGLFGYTHTPAGHQIDFGVNSGNPGAPLFSAISIGVTHLF
jgi:hypothetical protein